MRWWEFVVRAAVSVLVGIMVFVGCSRVDEAGRFRVVSEQDVSSRTADVIEDTETGVQYLVMRGVYGSVSVTPLLDADGRPYVAHREFDQGAEMYLPWKGAAGKEGER